MRNPIFIDLRYDVPFILPAFEQVFLDDLQERLSKNTCLQADRPYLPTAYYRYPLRTSLGADGYFPTLCSRTSFPISKMLPSIYFFL